MSTLVAQTISNGTVSTSSANVIRGSAKAWVKWQGTSTILNSYNVSSVTRNSIGNYTLAFTNSLPASNYAVSMLDQMPSSTNWGTYACGTQTASTLQVFFTYGGTLYDPYFGQVTVNC